MTITVTVKDDAPAPGQGEHGSRDDTNHPTYTVHVTVFKVDLTHLWFDYSSGTSTGLTWSGLTDTHANWISNEFAGCQLNPNIGQAVTYTVASNTATTITVSGGPLTSHASAGDNYSVIYDNDALRIRKNYTTDVDLPEWVTGSRNEPAAYIKEKSVTVLARFTVSPASVTNAKIRRPVPIFLAASPSRPSASGLGCPLRSSSASPRPTRPLPTSRRTRLPGRGK